MQPHTMATLPSNRVLASPRRSIGKALMSISPLKNVSIRPIGVTTPYPTSQWRRGVLHTPHLSLLRGRDRHRCDSAGPFRGWNAKPFLVNLGQCPVLLHGGHRLVDFR